MGVKRETQDERHRCAAQARKRYGTHHVLVLRAGGAVRGERVVSPFPELVLRAAGKSGRGGGVDHWYTTGGVAGSVPVNFDHLAIVSKTPIVFSDVASLA